MNVKVMEKSTKSEADSFRTNLVPDIERFEKEVETVYSTLVLPHWHGELHGFSSTLYGYMMLCFSHIDLFSSYWQGDGSPRGQTKRMIEFMQTYLLSDREACSIAVQIWRHKLMHTGKPRRLVDKETGKVYKWLLQWGKDHLPANQHFTFSETGDSKILNIGLTYLLRDIKTGLENYMSDLSADSELQRKFKKVEKSLQNSRYQKF